MENHNFLWVNPLEMAIFNSKVLDYQRVMGNQLHVFSIMVMSWGYQSAKLGIYPLDTLAIKRGRGKYPINRSFNRTFIELNKWGIFHGHF